MNQKRTEQHEQQPDRWVHDMSNDDKWGVGDKADSKAFDTTMVGKQEYELIFGEHPHGRSDHNIYARSKDGHIEAFDGHRRLVDINIRSYNYLKESHYSGDEVRKGVNIEIIVDGVQVYEAFHRDPANALLRAYFLLGELQEHSSNWLSRKDRQSLIGRKIFYRSTPAVIERLIEDQGCIIIRTEDGKPFPPPVWRETGEDDEQEASIKDDVLSKNIWWFRS